MFKQIYVDIDQDYERFKGSKTYQHIKENVANEKLSFLMDNIVRVMIRKSSSGNVHLRLDLHHPVGVLEMMMLRSCFHDDTVRIAIDLRRLALQGEDEINRIFSSKYKDGKKYEVGEWQVWWESK